jgi:uncharacterized protein YjcR
MEKRAIVQRIIGHYTHGNKASFARKLGVSPQLINTWISRNTFDIDLIYAKCEFISAEFLLTGQGEMLRQPATELANSAAQQSMPDSNDGYKEKYLELIEKYSALQEKYIALKET